MRLHLLKISLATILIFNIGFLGAPTTHAETLDEAIRAAAERYFKNNPDARSGASSQLQALNKAQVREAQTLLNQLGYNAGTPDGISGKNTRSAASLFALDRGLDNRSLNQGLLTELRKSAAPSVHAAAARGDLAATKELIANGANPDARDQKGWPAIAHAAFKGHDEVFAYLFEVSKNPASPLPDGSTPVALAAIAKHEKILEIALRDPERAGLLDENRSGVSAASIVARQNAAFPNVAGRIKQLSGTADQTLKSAAAFHRVFRTSKDWLEIFPKLHSIRWRTSKTGACGPINLRLTLTPVTFTEVRTREFLPPDMKTPTDGDARTFFADAFQRRGFLTYRADTDFLYMETYVEESGSSNYIPQPTQVLYPCFETAAPLSAARKAKLDAEVAKIRSGGVDRSEQLTTQNRFIDVALRNKKDWAKVLGSALTIQWRIENGSECINLLDALPARFIPHLTQFEEDTNPASPLISWKVYHDFRPYAYEFLYFNSGYEFSDNISFQVVPIDDNGKYYGPAQNTVSKYVSFYPCYRQ